MELISNTNPIETNIKIQNLNEGLKNTESSENLKNQRSMDDLIVEKNIKKSFLNIEEIKDCLRSYGLNPNDWALVQDSPHREKPLMLTHKKDSTFKLMAFLDWQERPVVKDLCVYSV